MSVWKFEKIKLWSWTFLRFTSCRNLHHWSQVIDLQWPKFRAVDLKHETLNGTHGWTVPENLSWDGLLPSQSGSGEVTAPPNHQTLINLLCRYLQQKVVSHLPRDHQVTTTDLVQLATKSTYKMLVKWSERFCTPPSQTYGFFMKFSVRYERKTMGKCVDM